ncbi:MAG: endonuclease VIII, partial [Oscillospiraceae bacterium]|nr:endonuclease VIII [Oscillospiraceae bacterium]
MLELPEALVISGQLNRTVKGKRIKEVIAAKSPHKFAWYYGEPSEYDALLRGRAVESAAAYGGRINIEAEGVTLHFCDGVNLRYFDAGETLPVKHQLLVSFDDGSALVTTVAMYGGMMAFPAGAMDDDLYYKAAKEAVPPLTVRFDYEYFIT